MEIIQTELRLKDIEWVEKAIENLKKTGRSLGSNSLADKARKEEIATTERILKVLTEEKRDVRKADWNNKEVSSFAEYDLTEELTLCPSSMLSTASCY